MEQARKYMSKSESLLSKIFNYEIPKMKEYVHEPKDEAYFHKLIQECHRERQQTSQGALPATTVDKKAHCITPTAPLVEVPHISAQENFRFADSSVPPQMHRKDGLHARNKNFSPPKPDQIKKKCRRNPLSTISSNDLLLNRTNNMRSGDLLKNMPYPEHLRGLMVENAPIPQSHNRTASDPFITPIQPYARQKAKLNKKAESNISKRPDSHKFKTKVQPVPPSLHTQQRKAVRKRNIHDKGKRYAHNSTEGIKIVKCGVASPASTDQLPNQDFDSDVSDFYSDKDFGDDLFDNSFQFQSEIGSSTYSNTRKEVESISRKLDFDLNQKDSSTSEQFHDLEYSYIADMCSDQSDGDSEDDYADDINYETYEVLEKAKKVVKEYATLGAPNVQCDKCHAWMWKEERVNKSVVKGKPVFSICCAKGQIQLPKEKPTPSYIWQLHNDKKKAQRFKDGIRLYNSLFAFTSTGGKVDHSINNGGAPYVYRLNGQNHHLFGSLIPDEGDEPKFCQLYIYDTENEISNRLRWVNADDGDNVDAEIVEGLMKMLDETNELVKEFRSARDRYEKHGVQDLEIILKVSRSESGRENHITPSDEVAGIMVGDMDDTDGVRDIIINSKIKGLERITDIHPKLMALQYPLLFPHGCDGFHKEIPFGTSQNMAQKRREMITMKEYYSYKLQVRTNQAMTPRLGGRLYQQYIVDAFSSIEQARLWWFRTHQTTLRTDLYTNVKNSMTSGNSDTSNMGKGFILPSGFVGSRRYMQQNFQDALAVCRYIGHPDVFLTMTTNPVWDEIMEMMKLIPHCSPQNSPDVIARVFHLKLQQLVDDIKKKNYFGTCLGVMYVVEFQKRGLPHVHMLIWLDSASKLNLQANVDKYVSAEIPDEKIDPVGHAAVKAFMMHGPCGKEFPKSPCMKQFKCTRHFPKKFCQATTFDQSGFPIYKRRQTNITVKKGKADLDNQWVVPYNRDLLVRYQCHMNVEICAHARSLKYLFKYCLKGHDRATVEIRGKKQRPNNGDLLDQNEDEIQSFFDGRYICACEAAYRIFGFNIHYRSLAVERLSFHLEGQKQCTFRSNEPLEKIAEREKERHTQLEAYFILNSTDTNAKKFLYDEIPQYYVWNDVDRIWTTRKRGKKIGRLSYTHHSAGELWYLRLLLTKVRGATSFEHLRTVKGTIYSTFHEACKEYGLLDDDSEWDQVLQECSVSGFPQQIRQLFVHIMVNCKVSDLNSLWNNHWKNMVDDILLNQRRITGNPLLILNEKQQQFYALAEIHNLLKTIGKSIKEFNQLPQPPNSYLDCSVNNLIIEETSYNITDMKKEYEQLFASCNKEQLEVYHAVMESVEKNEGGVFFIYGSGGCGKTYLWRTLISKLRSECKIVLPVASSGIAATLMPGGRTAHSRFKIPIVLDEYSMCSISHTSDIAELIKKTSLIIWDEAPMQHRYSFECLDRSLRDIMKAVDPKRFHMPFGGITIVLGGDFRQILPVIPLAGRGEIVGASITRSKLWKLASVYKLHHNMRLNKGNNREEIEALTHFAQWVLDIGDGKVGRPTNNNKEYGEDDIAVPKKFCNLDSDNSVDQMIHNTFPNFWENYQDPDYLSERAILTPTNQTVGNVNSIIVEKIPGEMSSYYSLDTAEDYPGTQREQLASFPPEYLNSLNIPGLPLHELKLKVGVVVMLMRNLNQTLGLCNGTRMMVTKCLQFCVECEVIAGQFKGTKHFIPRMELCPTETRLPFKLCRKQMPLQVCYAMTINKAQGQSLERVGLFLPKGVFTHGQFYVAVSRVTSPQGLKLFIDDENGNSTYITQNVVYKEVFYNLPVI
ncbi:uncharacterized protein LOC108202501 isoform X1 [Daucus carota subsp. sativus]|uniref:uncharacterized protein LOC108202501 isoform X1 n=1 Tax=Daucus carota subsp. sativus TaxID=79200 RepID=UPI0007F02E9C|nr:PREDICTED: uncharacterized protein LOC108202501 isoform X2 [Daucus carota subsp. sativus]